MEIKKKAFAEWSGGVETGTGKITTESKALREEPYSFKKRFEGEKGTNPEELIGAAHAGCFTMAVAQVLKEAGFEAQELDTGATVSLEKGEEGFSISKIHLDLEIKIEGPEKEKILELVNLAKKTCPVSKVLKADISLKAKFV